MDEADTLDPLDNGPMDDATLWGFIALIERYDRDMAALDAACDL